MRTAMRNAPAVKIPHVTNHAASESRRSKNSRSVPPAMARPNTIKPDAKMRLGSMSAKLTTWSNARIRFVA
jgi:hypothetical protein